MIIPIKPVSSFPAEATQLECVDTVVELGQGLSTEYRLLDKDGKIVSPRLRASLTDKQYDQWTGDDAFVCECIAENVGLTPV